MMLFLKMAAWFPTCQGWRMGHHGCTYIGEGNSNEVYWSSHKDCIAVDSYILRRVHFKGKPAFSVSFIFPNLPMCFITVAHRSDLAHFGCFASDEKANIVHNFLQWKSKKKLVSVCYSSKINSAHIFYGKYITAWGNRTEKVIYKYNGSLWKGKRSKKVICGCTVEVIAAVEVLDIWKDAG